MTSANEGRRRPTSGDGSRTTPSVSRETPSPESGGVSRETAERLDELLALVRRWNPAVNLVGRRDLAFLRERHVADSLRLAPFLPPDLDRAIDLGSGGGFPGLVLAIATGVPFDLVEADQRKAAFLAEAGRHLSAPVRVVARRIEDAGLEPARVVTARALAPLRRLLGLAAPLLASGGECLLLKGRGTHAELAEARAEWDFAGDLVGRGNDGDGVVLRIARLSKLAPSVLRPGGGRVRRAHR